MRKTFLIILIAIILSYFVWKMAKKGLAATQLQFDVDDIDLSKLSAFGADSNIALLISNYSNEKYTIDNIYVEIYSQDGSVLVGYQKTPLHHSITIAPNANTSIDIPVYLKTALISQLMNQLGLDNISTFWQVFQDYFAKGHLGTFLLIKGFAVIKGIKIPFKFQKEV